MEPKTLKYFTIFTAIILLLASLLYLLMLGMVLLVLVDSWYSPYTFNPGVMPFVLSGAGLLLLFGFILLRRWRGNLATHRIVLFAIGVISIVIGVLYFLFPFGPIGPPPTIDPTAPGPVLMYCLPIIGGILTIIAPSLKVEE